MIRTRAEQLLIITGLFGVLHHADHVLRVNHSGWPFIADVTPFTYSLVVYPLMATVLLLRGRHWLRVGLSILLFLFPTLAHIFIETPMQQYHTWTARPDVNMLEVSSPVLGSVAVAITIALSGFAFWAMYAFVQEARQASR